MGLPVIDGHAIQVLWQGATIQRTFTGTTARVQIGAGVKIVELWCDQDCHVRFGDSTIEAAVTNSAPLTAKIPIPRAVPADQNYIAVIKQATNGTLWITYME